MFDAARGRRARAALEQARAAGRQAEAKELVAAMRKTAPPQILIRCQFCSTNISPPKGAFLPGEQREGRKGDGPRGHKVRGGFCLRRTRLTGDLGRPRYVRPARSSFRPAPSASPVLQSAPSKRMAVSAVSTSAFPAKLTRNPLRSRNPLLVHPLPARRTRFSPPRLVRECVSVPSRCSLTLLTLRSTSLASLRGRWLRLRVQQPAVTSVAPFSPCTVFSVANTSLQRLPVERRDLDNLYTNAISAAGDVGAGRPPAAH
jgi:hypothetical protein